ncbi:hypothetical protein ACFOD4_00800 [Pseudoroseomonas globiformis]|uniref:Uncharacterized protein n=1 Tax=Teichococcus globiformis TaxID=2307229 RepID=A0ABV7FZ99_9PROT
MFHHRSGGTLHLVALMAAHRTARDSRTDLQQGEIARVIDRLDLEDAERTPLPGRLRRQEARAQQRR